MKKNRKILVLYHANCPDGFGAAWAAWKKFGNKAEYIAVAPEQLPPVFPRGWGMIYAVDVSYPLMVQKELRAANKEVIIIDHHISLAKDTKYFAENIFDNNHSGSVLAWQYFFPKKPIPRLLRYVEDVDIWKMKLPKTKCIMPYIYMQERSFEGWNKIAREFETQKGFHQYSSRGALLEEYEKGAINEILKRAETVLFEKKKIYAVNNTFKRYTSELGHRLVLKKGPMSVIWYEDGEGLHVSLRAFGKIDVSKIAGKYGGGGHKNASSFIVSNFKKPWKKTK